MIESLLARIVIASLPLEKFETEFEEEVGDPADEVCQRVLSVELPKKGLCSLFVLRGGITVMEDSRGRWSAYESAESVAEREYISSWNAFIRAGWTPKIPDKAGVYPVRTLEGHRGKDRELRLVAGKLKDVTIGTGFQGGMRVSEWRGEWWSQPYPALKGAL